jgi:hypothetical protein
MQVSLGVDTIIEGIEKSVDASIGGIEKTVESAVRGSPDMKYDGKAKHLRSVAIATRTMYNG